MLAGSALDMDLASGEPGGETPAGSGPGPAGTSVARGGSYMSSSESDGAVGRGRGPGGRLDGRDGTVVGGSSGAPRAQRRRTEGTDCLQVPTQVHCMPGLRACSERALRRIAAFRRMAEPQDRVKKAWGRRLALCQRLWHVVDQTAGTARQFVASTMADDALVRRAAGVGSEAWDSPGMHPGPGSCIHALERDRQWARVLGLLCACALRQLRRETLRASRVLWYFVGGAGSAGLMRCLRLVTESLDELGLRSEAAMAALRAQVNHCTTKGGRIPGCKTTLTQWSGGVDVSRSPHMLGHLRMLPVSVPLLLSHTTGRPIEEFRRHPRVQVLE